MYTGFFERMIVRLYVVLFTEHLKVAGYTLMTLTRKDAFNLDISSQIITKLKSVSLFFKHFFIPVCIIMNLR